MNAHGTRRQQSRRTVEPRSADDASQAKLIREICRRLRRLYGPARKPRPFDPLSELIFTILSQNTADRNTERAFAELRRRYPTWEQVLHAPTDEVAGVIRSAGLANQKAPRIQRVIQWAIETFGKADLSALARMPPERALELLRRIDGIGPKTAACVLLFGCDRPVLPVDTHVFRVSKRLGLLPPRCTPEKAHEFLGRLVPPKLVLAFHVYLIRLGREVCTARNPRCEECPLADLCAFARSRLDSGH